MSMDIEAAVKPVDSENPNGEFQLVLTNDSLDRDGDRLWADAWAELPSKIHLDSDHAFSKGMSVPFTAGSGIPAMTENGEIVVRGTYAGTDHGQLVRQLVNEGHIWQASVSYQENEDGQRELLNGTFCGVPANPEAVVTSSKSADAKKPYGGVRYADPGYQDDGKARYPIDTEEHVRAALSYFGQAKNRSQYSSAQQRTILGRIRSAARRMGVEVSDGVEKALMIAMCKAITLSKKDATQQAARVIPESQDVGAQSVYDKPYSDDDDESDDDSDVSGTDELWQSLHDAAVALGNAVCPGDCGTGEKTVNITNVLPSGGATAADDTAAPNGATVKSAAAVTPKDLAARVAAARLRKFRYEQKIQETDL